MLPRLYIPAWLLWEAARALAVLALAGAALLAGVLQYGMTLPRLPRMCGCSRARHPLAHRFGAADAAIEMYFSAPGPLTFSAVFAYVGFILGWFVGRPFVRMPMDDLFWKRAHDNYVAYGCVNPNHVCGVL